MGLRSFAAQQAAESRLIETALGEQRPDWLLEMAPATSPSPRLEFPRCRILLNENGCCWPFRARPDELPLDDESVPAVLLRHLWQPGLSVDPLAETIRLLKPGGLLISVSANPWHPSAWGELGRAAMWLPSWPHFQLLHSRYRLQLNQPVRELWRGMVPGLSALLILTARKPRRPATVRRIKFSRPVVAGPAGAVSQCRAA